MRTRFSILSTAIVTLAATLAVAPIAHAQFAGQGARDSFIDTSVLKPAPGSAVSILVFEDLGCPACARAHPIELAVAAKDHVPLLRRDFPLAAHIWTFDGAVFARYLQDKTSPQIADQYRSDVFASQMQIGSKDDLRQWNTRWMGKHGQAMPPVIDPTGALAAEVKADYDLGMKLHVTLTPTIVVVTKDQYQVVCGTAAGANDPNQLAAVVQGALALAKPAAPVRRASGTH